MSWPPSQSSTTYRQRGSTIATLAWGTDGIYNGVIVKSLRVRPMIEEPNIINGSGLTGTQVVINDGEQVEITVEDDRSVTFPQSMEVVSLLNPRSGNGTVSSTTPYQVLNNDYNTGRKQNGERIILAKAYALITPQGNSPQAPGGGGPQP